MWPGLVKGVRDDYRSAKDKGKEKKDGEKDNKEDADNPKDALERI